jgi:hypothetical protein
MYYVHVNLNVNMNAHGAIIGQDRWDGINGIAGIAGLLSWLTAVDDLVRARCPLQ